MADSVELESDMGLILYKQLTIGTRKSCCLPRCVTWIWVGNEEARHRSRDKHFTVSWSGRTTRAECGIEVMVSDTAACGWNSRALEAIPAALDGWISTV